MPIIQIDARGLSCPEPVMKTMTACAQFIGDPIEVQVDTEVARDNCRRFAQHAGFTVTVSEGSNGEYTLGITR